MLRTPTFLEMVSRLPAGWYISTSTQGRVHSRPDIQRRRSTSMTTVYENPLKAPRSLLLLCSRSSACGFRGTPAGVMGSTFNSGYLFFESAFSASFIQFVTNESPCSNSSDQAQVSPPHFIVLRSVGGDHCRLVFSATTQD